MVVACALPLSASAAVVTNERTTELAATEVCGGELVTVEATIHILSRVTVDAEGVAHLGSTITTFFRGTSASGALYIGPSHQTTQLLGEPDSERVDTQTFNQQLILTGENGTDDDLRNRAIFHFTLNANGELVADKFEFVSECA